MINLVEKSRVQSVILKPNVENRRENGRFEAGENECLNKGNATAADVMELIRQVTAKVKEDTGVTMEPEVKQIGEF